MKKFACPHCGGSIDGYTPGPGDAGMQIGGETLGVHDGCGRVIHFQFGRARKATEQDMRLLPTRARTEVASLMLENMAAGRPERNLV